MAHKTYGQFCGLARALDHVGDRWTLLVVRELLVGPRGYGDLRDALVGISPNLLVERLRALEGDGLVRRNDAPRRSKAVVYELTPDGAALEPTIHELIRWGTRWMASGPGDDRVDASWAALALRALLATAEPQAADGVVHVAVDGADLLIEVRRDGRTVHRGPVTDADARVSGPITTILAIASGLAPLDAGGLSIEGDERLAEIAMSPLAAASA